MECPQGHVVADEASFCAMCGAPIRVSEPVGVPATPASPPPATSPTAASKHACSVCGKPLGRFERLRGHGVCDDDRERIAREQDAARTKYEAMLSELTLSGAQSDYMRTVREAEQQAQLAPKDLDRVKTAAVRRLIGEALADNILSVQEEQELSDVFAGLGFDQMTFLRSNPDSALALQIAAINDGRLPQVVAAGLMTKKDEAVHGHFSAALLKHQAVRQYQGGYSGFSFHVAKGVRYHVGGTRGHSVVVGDRLIADDHGALFVTSVRAVFAGAKRTIEVPYKKLATFQVFSDGLELHATNRQAAVLMKLQSPDLVAAMINAAAQRVLDS